VLLCEIKLVKSVTVWNYICKYLIVWNYTCKNVLQSDIIYVKKFYSVKLGFKIVLGSGLWLAESFTVWNYVCKQFYSLNSESPFAKIALQYKLRFEKCYTMWNYICK
jgi:hypothetical protein